MERYSPEQIAEVLRLHQLWLDDEEGGVRANLDRANLYGANLDGANLDGAKNFSKFVAIGPIGSRNGYTYAHLDEDKIRCGCFTGTLQEFENAVRKTHKNNPLHLASYLAVIAMVKALREAQPEKGEATPAAPAPYGYINSYRGELLESVAVPKIAAV